MEGSFRRGWGADFYDEPDWPAALAGLQGRYRLDILRAGLLLIERTAAQGDQARVRSSRSASRRCSTPSSRCGRAGALFMTDLRPSGARGIQRQGLYTVAEVVNKLDTLLTLETWALRQRRLESANGSE